MSFLSWVVTIALKQLNGRTFGCKLWHLFQSLLTHMRIKQVRIAWHALADIHISTLVATNHAKRTLSKIKLTYEVVIMSYNISRQKLKTIIPIIVTIIMVQITALAEKTNQREAHSGLWSVSQKQIAEATMSSISIIRAFTPYRKNKRLHLRF